MCYYLNVHFQGQRVNHKNKFPLLLSFTSNYEYVPVNEPISTEPVINLTGTAHWHTVHPTDNITRHIHQHLKSQPPWHLFFFLLHMFRLFNDPSNSPHKHNVNYWAINESQSPTISQGVFRFSGLLGRSLSWGSLGSI